MSQVPNSHLLLVKDFVFLVVCEHIVFYQLVVDDGGLDSFRILFYFAFGLQLIAHV